jgi:hypothetical protein
MGLHSFTRISLPFSKTYMSHRPFWHAAAFPVCWLAWCSVACGWLPTFSWFLRYSYALCGLRENTTPRSVSYACNGSGAPFRIPLVLLRRPCHEFRERGAEIPASSVLHLQRYSAVLSRERRAGNGAVSMNRSSLEQKSLGETHGLPAGSQILNLVHSSLPVDLFLGQLNQAHIFTHLLFFLIKFNITLSSAYR